MAELNLMTKSALNARTKTGRAFEKFLRKWLIIKGPIFDPPTFSSGFVRIRFAPWVDAYESNGLINGVNEKVQNFENGFTR